MSDPAGSEPNEANERDIAAVGEFGNSFGEGSFDLNFVEKVLPARPGDIEYVPSGLGHGLHFSAVMHRAYVNGTDVLFEIVYRG
jgi:hypothetical protein